MDKLAENIKILREEKGISQSQLADRLFVTRQAVTRWEKGNTRPDIETIGKLAEIFDVSVEYLITGKELVKEVVVEKEVVKEVPVEKIVEKKIIEEVPPDDYDFYKGEVMLRLTVGIVCGCVLWLMFLIFLILCLALLPIAEAWFIDLIWMAFVVFIPLVIIKEIRTYINPNFLKFKNKNKGDKKK